MMRAALYQGSSIKGRCVPTASLTDRFILWIEINSREYKMQLFGSLDLVCNENISNATFATDQFRIFNKKLPRGSDKLVTRCAKMNLFNFVATLDFHSRACRKTSATGIAFLQVVNTYMLHFENGHNSNYANMVSIYISKTPALLP